MTDQIQLEIPLILPDIPDADDACVARLTADLSARAGIEKAHVVPAKGDKPALLCIHYDSDTLSLSRIRDIARSAGAAIAERYGHVLWPVSGIGHQRKARTVSEQLHAMSGVIEADANASGLVRVEFDRDQVSEKQIVDALSRLGVRRSAAAPGGAQAGNSHGAGREDLRADHAHGDGHGHDHDHGGVLGSNTELIFALACGALLGIGFAIDKLDAGVSTWLSIAFYIGAYVSGGFFTVREAIDNLRLRKFEIDTLMLLAAAGAAALGAFAEGALLLFLFSLGHALEHYAMGRAKRAIEALAELAPRTALLRLEDGGTEEVAVEELVPRDLIVVKPDTRIPADGFLVKGTTSINQAPVTGESMPVDKRPVMDDAAARANPDRIDAANRAFAGTINGSGLIEIEVTRSSVKRRSKGTPDRRRRGTPFSDNMMLVC